ncbi:MAG TPA: HipA family kinase [Vicinamibacterales bacterium]|nr:HipA family kinase [Vicinamibacterales bacterium]
MGPLRTVRVTRYVTPLREGGSLPAIVEADDDGLYVLKFRGAGQGPRALIAELVAGEIARALNLPVPELVFANLDSDLARTEPDPEIFALIAASGGLNLALDYLPGAVMFDPLVNKPDADLASRLVWFDAFVSNVDRTVRNPNLLVWHRRLWLIDHGASLYFHHQPDWIDEPDRAADPFALIRDHVMRHRATHLEQIDEAMAAALDAAAIDEIVAMIPDAWLSDDGPADAVHARAGYGRYLRRRLESPRRFVEEAVRVR